MNVSILQNPGVAGPRPTAVARTPEAVKVAGAVDLTLDLTRSSRNVLGAIFGLSTEGLQDFLKITSDLLKAGVVGREVVEVNGQPRETFTDARIADPALRDAPPYRGRSLDIYA